MCLKGRRVSKLELKATWLSAGASNRFNYGTLIG
jgi:hypothetical protein